MIKGIDHLGIAVENIDEVLVMLQEAFDADELTRKEYPQLQQVSSIVSIRAAIWS